MSIQSDYVHKTFVDVREIMQVSNYKPMTDVEIEVRSLVDWYLGY